MQSLKHLNKFEGNEEKGKEYLLKIVNLEENWKGKRVQKNLQKKILGKFRNEQKRR